MNNNAFTYQVKNFDPDLGFLRVGSSFLECMITYFGPDLNGMYENPIQAILLIKNSLEYVANMRSDI